VDLFGGVQGVAVSDGVDQGFLKRQVDAEDVVLGPLPLVELSEDFLPDFAARPRLAQNHVVALPNPTRLGHGIEKNRGWLCLLPI